MSLTVLQIKEELKQNSKYFSTPVGPVIALSGSDFSTAFEQFEVSVGQEFITVFKQLENDADIKDFPAIKEQLDNMTFLDYHSTISIYKLLDNYNLAKASKGKAKISGIVPTSSASIDVLKNLVAEKKTESSVVIDMAKVRTQTLQFINKLDKNMVREQFKKITTRLDSFYVIFNILQDPEVDHLFVFCALRNLMTAEDREKIDNLLTQVEVLSNKNGKLSRRLVSVMGFVGLAIMKDAPKYQTALEYIKNPLLKEDPVDNGVKRITGLSTKEKKEKKEEHEEIFAAYKKMMDEIKQFSVNYEKIPKEVKSRVLQCFHDWLG